MKNLLYILASILLFTACSKETEIINDESETPEVDPPAAEICRFQLTAEQTQINIFDFTKFSIADEKGSSMLLGLNVLAKSYDSIVWEVKGVKERLRIFYTYSDSNHSESSLKSTWGHCFYLPGKQETYLLGYKGKEIIHRDTLQVKVGNQKDFLGRNWGDTDNLGINIGHNNALNEDYTFLTLANKQNNTPTVDLRLMNASDVEAPLFSEKSRKELYNYMVQVYGKPACENNSAELNTKYNTFQVQASEVTPLAYWLSGKAKMILLEKKIESEAGYCYIHAEP